MIKESETINRHAVLGERCESQEVSDVANWLLLHKTQKDASKHAISQKVWPSVLVIVLVKAEFLVLRSNEQQQHKGGVEAVVK